MIEADLMRIVNSEALTSIFGTWPSFHDAEVRSVRMRVEGSSTPCLEADIHLFQMSSDVTDDGHNKLVNETLATLWFEGVRDVKLDDFSFQNVLWGLSIVDVTGDQHENVEWEITFEASVGLAGSFRCGMIAVLSAEPFASAANTEQASGTQSRPKPGTSDGS